MRRRLLLVLALAVIGTAWVGNVSTAGVPGGCPRDCADAARLPGPLRVLSLNVLHGFPTFERLGERLDLVAAEIVDRHVDVALLQEVPWTIGVGDGARRLAQATGLNHVYARANGQRWAIGFEEGSAILSRFPLRDVASVELAPAAGPFEHRIALAATADTPWGPLRLVVTHLTDANAEVNRRQALSLADWTDDQPRPMLVAGDFNATPDSPTYAALPPEWTDAFRAANPDDPGYTCCTDDLGAAEARMTARIDYAFSVGRVGVREATVALRAPIGVGAGWLRASDHAGLLLTLDLRPAGTSWGRSGPRVRNDPRYATVLADQMTTIWE